MSKTSQIWIGRIRLIVRKQRIVGLSSDQFSAIGKALRAVFEKRN